MRRERERELSSKKDFQELLLDLIHPLLSCYSEGAAQLELGVTATSYDRKAIYVEAFSRPLWEPLGEEEKDNLSKWLYGINEYQLPVCNWRMFAVLVNVALKKLGRKYSAEMLEYYLEGTDSFYLGDGWYQDGESQQKDYYVSFAIHFYSLFYARVMEKEDPARCKLFKERAEIFAKQFIYWFDDDGAALPFGRSLTYRFAQASFWSACLLADVMPFPVGVIKGLIVRHLCDWLKKPIFDRNGILTIGYGYPNLIMGEMYNGPGSPYWALKIFAFLMLPDNHPFWTAEALPMPELKEQIKLPYADMLVHRYPNHTTAFVPGKYGPSNLIFRTIVLLSSPTRFAQWVIFALSRNPPLLCIYTVYTHGIIRYLICQDIS